MKRVANYTEALQVIDLMIQYNAENDQAGRDTGHTLDEFAEAIAAAVQARIKHNDDVALSALLDL